MRRKRKRPSPHPMMRRIVAEEDVLEICHEVDVIKEGDCQPRVRPMVEEWRREQSDVKQSYCKQGLDRKGA